MSLAILRERLSQPPSQEIFHEICQLFSKWQGKHIDLMLKYAEEHMATWDETIRYASNINWDSPPCWWPLVRSYSHENGPVPNQWFQQHCLLSSLKRLTLKSVSIQDLSILSSCDNLSHLELPQCESLENIEGIESLTTLKNLNLRGCLKIQSFKPLTSRPNLEALDLSQCALRNLDIFVHLPKLRHLSLSSGNMENLDALANLSNLTNLKLSHSPLGASHGLANLKSLTHLELSSCWKLSEISALSKLTNLQSLSLLNCENIKSLHPLTNLKELSSLSLSFCGKLQKVHTLASLNHLASLHIRDCKSLELQPEHWNMNTQEKIKGFQKKLEAYNQEKQGHNIYHLCEA